MDQDTWMNRQRMAARGNATAFPLAWEDLLQQLQAKGAHCMGVKKPISRGSAKASSRERHG